jgi:hypothetical protein
VSPLHSLTDDYGCHAHTPHSLVHCGGEGRHGIMLKKVANFYNNMETQIIHAQKPMLLDSLLAFEEVRTAFAWLHKCIDTAIGSGYAARACAHALGRRITRSPADIKLWRVSRLSRLPLHRW